MYIVKTVPDLQKIISSKHKYNGSIGFVPTMGALHEGHLALVKEAARNNQISVASIFVNPAQFNNAEDLSKYPRTEEEDIDKLSRTDVDILFLPEAGEIYPKEGFEMPAFKLDHLIQKLEGERRPGHFEGVVKVIYRFLDMVRPTDLYMGLKDFQQQLIVGTILEQMGSSVRLNTLPTTREENGLAMSSRNVRLSTEAREKAGVIYNCLKEIRVGAKEGRYTKEKENAFAALTYAGYEVEYIEWVDAKTLEPVDSIGRPSVILLAVWVDEVRLIDNILV